MRPWPDVVYHYTMHLWGVIDCNALRHSAATWARAGGARLDAIAGMLGHASLTTTDVYAKIVDKIAENPARYLEELMGLS